MYIYKYIYLISKRIYMKLSKKLYEYEIKNQDPEYNLINEKINYTTKKYFYLVNNFSKEISHIENDINILRQNSTIKINELIYNQHIIIKELISIINNTHSTQNDPITSNNPKKNTKTELLDNITESHIISFSIISNNNNSEKNFRIIDPSPIYKLNINNSNYINTSFSKNDTSKSLDKKIMNTLSTIDIDNSLNIHNKYKFFDFTPMTQKIKNENSMQKYYNNFSKSNYIDLKNKLKYKCYKPSFLNSFVSGKKTNNKVLKTKKDNIELLSTSINSYYDRKKNIKNKKVSTFNATNSCGSKKNGIKRVKSTSSYRCNKLNNSFYNIRIIDDSIVNNFLDRNCSKAKANKYIRNLYFISNKIVDKYQKKFFND